eukprot:1993094-Pyramimonas_sp.AAC.1
MINKKLMKMQMMMAEEVDPADAAPEGHASDDSGIAPPRTFYRSAASPRTFFQENTRPRFRAWPSKRQMVDLKPDRGPVRYGQGAPAGATAKAAPKPKPEALIDIPPSSDSSSPSL